MKKILALVLALMILALGVCSCASNKVKVTIATSPDFPPFEDLNNGEFVGIEMDLVKLVCEKLGYDYEFVSVDFDSIITGVQAGKYTLAAAGISVDEDRKKNVDFATEYCLAAQAIVVKTTSAIKTKSDLDGKTIAVQTATTAEKYCQEQGYTILSYTANPDAELALFQGKVDAWVIDDLTADEMVKDWNKAHTGDEQLVVLKEAMTSEPYAFAFQKGSKLTAEFSKVIEEFIKDGTIQKLFEKYDAPYTKPEV